MPLAQCPAGEEEDLYTGVLSAAHGAEFYRSVSSIPGNPDLPAVDGIPCTGRNTGECIGLSEEEQAMGPQPVPRSTVSSSP